MQMNEQEKMKIIEPLVNSLIEIYRKEALKVITSFPNCETWAEISLSVFTNALGTMLIILEDQSEGALDMKTSVQNINKILMKYLVKMH